jgi:hypothetical protein
MAHRYASHAEKLARLILKAPSKGPAGQRLTLPIFEGWLLGERPAENAAADHARNTERLVKVLCDEDGIDA